MGRLGYVFLKVRINLKTFYSYLLSTNVNKHFAKDYLFICKLDFSCHFFRQISLTDMVLVNLKNRFGNIFQLFVYLSSNKNKYYINYPLATQILSNFLPFYDLIFRERRVKCFRLVFRTTYVLESLFFLLLS